MMRIYDALARYVTRRHFVSGLYAVESQDPQLLHLGIQRSAQPFCRTIGAADHSLALATPAHTLETAAEEAG
jgi:hypothetical protein